MRVDPAVAVVNPHGSGQDVERLGDGSVEVRVRAARVWSHGPQVQAELTVGGCACCQVVHRVTALVGQFWRAASWAVRGADLAAGPQVTWFRIRHWPCLSVGFARVAGCPWRRRPAQRQAPQPAIHEWWSSGECTARLHGRGPHTHEVSLSVVAAGGALPGLAKSLMVVLVAVIRIWPGAAAHQYSHPPGITA